MPGASSKRRQVCATNGQPFNSRNSLSTSGPMRVPLPAATIRAEVIFQRGAASDRFHLPPSLAPRPRGWRCFYRGATCAWRAAKEEGSRASRFRHRLIAPEDWRSPGASPAAARGTARQRLGVRRSGASRATPNFGFAQENTPEKSRCRGSTKAIDKDNPMKSDGAPSQQAPSLHRYLDAFRVSLAAQAPGSPCSPNRPCARLFQGAACPTRCFVAGAASRAHEVSRTGQAGWRLGPCRGQ